ncbi:hypothetical protein OZX62_05170 [Bifidobacterium sp. ESL0690]|uniref:hypothetical protein n=1 Tax=Bifidobacterium sp. ESL0690 TaxID=2983214 RepID=UPI0023F9CC7F|nr:hypothetical protein [Bifidobacterium sp. ESL0690]WEV47653.1 hypothetical protein OZX62_05170 [Bifidobacterium sp. ESL0690]
MGFFDEVFGKNEQNGKIDGKDAKIVSGRNNKTGEDKVDIYYGGKGVPDGPGHSHIVVNSDDMVTYMREGGDHDDPDIDYGDTGKDPVIK